MSEAQPSLRVKRPRRRAEAIQQIVEEYESSGQSRREFCRQHGLVLSTLDRYLRKQRAVSAANPDLVRSGLLPVKIATPAGGGAEKALVVVLPRGCKVEVGIGFDAATLTRVVAVLEGR